MIFRYDCKVLIVFQINEKFSRTKENSCILKLITALEEYFGMNILVFILKTKISDGNTDLTTADIQTTANYIELHLRELH